MNAIGGVTAPRSGRHRKWQVQMRARTTRCSDRSRLRAATAAAVCAAFSLAFATFISASASCICSPGRHAALTTHMATDSRSHATEGGGAGRSGRGQNWNTEEQSGAAQRCDGEPSAAAPFHSVAGAPHLPAPVCPAPPQSPWPAPCRRGRCRPRLAAAGYQSRQPSPRRPPPAPPGAAPSAAREARLG